MQRDRLFVSEMIDAAEQARALTADIGPADLEHDRQRRDALLWNFTVLGEAAAKVSPSSRSATRRSTGGVPPTPATGSSTADLEILYNTASEHLGAMTEALTSVLAELEQSP
jgi:uncharacterized protein with HEPN domain